jgi:hypothetical protein
MVTIVPDDIRVRRIKSAGWLHLSRRIFGRSAGRDNGRATTNNGRKGEHINTSVQPAIVFGIGRLGARSATGMQKPTNVQAIGLLDHAGSTACIDGHAINEFQD